MYEARYSKLETADEAGAGLPEGDLFSDKKSNYANGDGAVAKIWNTGRRSLSRSVIIVHITLVLLYSTVFLAATIYVFAWKPKAPLSREDLNRMSAVI